MNSPARSVELQILSVQLTNGDSIYYHNLILSLFEPLLEIHTNQKPSPQQIVNDANKHIQTLIRLYYVRHGFEAMDLFIVIPLMVAGFNALSSINEQTPLPQLEVSRSTLILVAQGLYKQRQNHYLAQALFQIIRGRMRPQEAALMRETVQGEEHEVNEDLALTQAVRSHWPVSVVRKKEDLESHMLGNLVGTYAHLNINIK